MKVSSTPTAANFWQRFFACLKLDIRLQWRSQLYSIGIVVAILLGLALRFLFPAKLLASALPCFYIVGIGGTTLMFVAGMVLLEKSQRTFDAIRTSPVRSHDYILSKALSLSTFSLIESLIIFTIATPETINSLAALIFALAAFSLANTFLGLALVASHDAVTSFLFPSALITIGILQLNIGSVIEIGPPLLYYFIPTQGPLLLMLGAFGDLANWQWIYALLTSVAFVGATYFWARLRFRKFIQLQEG